MSPGRAHANGIGMIILSNESYSPRYAVHRLILVDRRRRKLTRQPADSCYRPRAAEDSW
jgi:hypothetical protein